MENSCDLLLRNPDLLFRNLDLLLKNVVFITQPGGERGGGREAAGAAEAAAREGDGRGRRRDAGGNLGRTE